MRISASMVKDLREKTGSGVMDAKRALEEAGGDQNKAREILLAKGLAAAASRAGRETSEGVIQAYIHSGSRTGAMVEVSCETDFVARTAEFSDLAHNLAMQVAAMSPRYVDKDSVPDGEDEAAPEELLLDQAYIRDPSITVQELIAQTAARTGENVRVRRFSRFALGE